MSLYEEPYNSPNSPTLSEAEDGKLMTHGESEGNEYEIRRLSGRYFAVFSDFETVVLSEGHGTQDEAEEAARRIGELLSPLDPHETL